VEKKVEAPKVEKLAVKKTEQKKESKEVKKE
jgi:hypothetical protein